MMLFKQNQLHIYCVIDPEAKARASGSEREMGRARARENFTIGYVVFIVAEICRGSQNSPKWSRDPLVTPFDPNFHVLQ